MKRISFFLVCSLLASCYGEPILDLHGGGGPLPTVCVQGEQGSCCAEWPICSIFDEGCEIGKLLPRTPTRCILCYAHEIDDGGARPPSVPTPNPEPPPMSPVNADGGVLEAIRVCGKATYRNP